MVLQLVPDIILSVFLAFPSYGLMMLILRPKAVTWIALPESLMLSQIQ